jgi:hypothetical protein
MFKAHQFQQTLDSQALDKQDMIHLIEDTLCCPEQRQVVSRFFFTIVTMLIVIMGSIEPSSVTYDMIQNGNGPAIISSGIMFLVSFLAWCDVVLNDILPPRFRFYFDRRQRYVLWGIMASIYIGYSFIFVRAGLTGWASVLYGVFGVWAATIAAMDVVYEYKERTKDDELQK